MILQFIILVILRVLLLIGKTWTCYYVYFGSSSIRCLLVLLEKSFFYFICLCVGQEQRSVGVLLHVRKLLNFACGIDRECKQVSGSVYMHIRYKRIKSTVC